MTTTNCGFRIVLLLSNNSKIINSKHMAKVDDENQIPPESLTDIKPEQPNEIEPMGSPTEVATAIKGKALEQVTNIKERAQKTQAGATEVRNNVVSKKLGKVINAADAFDYKLLKDIAAVLEKKQEVYSDTFIEEPDVQTPSTKTAGKYILERKEARVKFLSELFKKNNLKEQAKPKELANYINKASIKLPGLKEWTGEEIRTFMTFFYYFGARLPGNNENAYQATEVLSPNSASVDAYLERVTTPQKLQTAISEIVSRFRAVALILKYVHKDKQAGATIKQQFADYLVDMYKSESQKLPPSLIKAFGLQIIRAAEKKSEESPPRQPQTREDTLNRLRKFSQNVLDAGDRTMRDLTASGTNQKMAAHIASQSTEAKIDAIRADLDQSANEFNTWTRLSNKINLAQLIDKILLVKNGDIPA